MSKTENISVVLIAGGVGGAKLAEGFAHLDQVRLTVIGNVADDDQFHGLWVSPDIDTMIYTLSDRINREQGWGVKDESLRALDVLSDLGQDTWMTLGDRDFGLHIFRAMRLAQGSSRQQITDEICRGFNVPAQIILPTEDVVQTKVRTQRGWLCFQEYFVREQCRPEVLELSYRGLEMARPNKAALDAIQSADVIVIAPSNPLVSIAPILGIPGMRAAIENANVPKIAVSPLVGGKALKGPADRMMTSLGYEPTAGAIAETYAQLVDTLVIDASDANQKDAVEATGLTAEFADIVMSNRNDKRRLAQELLNLTLSETSEALL